MSFRVTTSDRIVTLALLPRFEVSDHPITRWPDRRCLACTKLANNRVVGRCYAGTALVSRRRLRKRIAGNQSQEAVTNSRSAGGFGARTYSGPRLPPNRSRHAGRCDGGGWRARGCAFFVRRTAFLADLGRCARIRAAAGTVADSPAPPSRPHPHRDRRAGAAQQFHL